MDTEGGRRGRPPHPDILTPAEWHVLEHLREGLTNAEIAVELGISPDGVKYHVSNMLAKLDLPDRHALAKWKPPRAGLRSRLSTRGLIAGTVGFFGVAAALAGIVVATGVFGGGAAVSSNLPDVRSSLAITTYELTETTYTAPELLQAPITAGQSSAAASALSHGIQQTIHVYFQSPDKSRTEKSGSAPGSVDVELINGGHILNWLPGINAVMETSDPFGRTDLAATNDSGQPADGTTLAQLMKTLANGAKVTLAGSDVVAGRPVYVIDVGAAPCPTGVPWLDGPKRYWLDKQTLFVLKAEQYKTSDHQLASSAEVTSIAYNQPLDPVLFAPPPGAKARI